MIIDVKDLNPVTVRKITKSNCGEHIYEIIEDGYEYQGIFISKKSGLPFFIRMAYSLLKYYHVKQIISV